MKNKFLSNCTKPTLIVQDAHDFWGIELDTPDEFSAALQYWYTHAGDTVDVEKVGRYVPKVRLILEIFERNPKGDTIHVRSLCHFCTKYVYHLTGKCPFCRGNSLKVRAQGVIYEK